MANATGNDINTRRTHDAAPATANWIEEACVDQAGWLVIIPRPSARRPASALSWQIQRQGFVDVPNKRLWASTAHNPPWFFHGTHADAAIAAVSGAGLRPGVELVAMGHDVQIHTPDGVYAYGLSATSDCSCYVVQGAQVAFSSVGITIGQASADHATRSFPGRTDGKIEILEGCRLRRYKSAARKAKSMAACEWIHHADSITMLLARLHPAAVIEFANRTQATKPIKVNNQPAGKDSRNNKLLDGQTSTT